MAAPTQPVLPLNIKQLIIDRSGTSMKRTLRLVSKDFKHLVDTSAITYDSLSVKLGHNSTVIISLKIDKPRGPRAFFESSDLEIEFRHHRRGYLVKNGSFEKLVVTKDTKFPFLNGAALHLAKIFKNPKTRFGQLSLDIVTTRESPREIRIYDSKKEEFKRELKETTFAQLAHQVMVEILTITFDGSQDDVLAVLPYLQPITLKKIDMISSEITGESVDIDQIVQTEQWKKSKHFKSISRNIVEPFSSWRHFSDVRIRIWKPTLEQFRAMLEHYSMTPTFQNATIDINSENAILDQCCNFLSPQSSEMALPENFQSIPNLVRCGELDKYKIDCPNTSDYLLLETLNNRIYIRKNAEYFED